ncbi:hypothetical protein RSAG8_04152, partial [Rhizoctonia solani AG-8 WAC10335]
MTKKSSTSPQYARLVQKGWISFRS